MVPLLKSLKNVGFDWNDEASSGKKQTPKKAKMSQQAWGELTLSLAPITVFKWLRMDSETQTVFSL